MTLYGQTITRTSVIYAAGMLGVVPTGLVSLAVTTRYLDPAMFGRLAVLFAIASVLTVLSGLAFVQGTLLAAYGVGDDDGDGDGPEIDANVGPARTGEIRRRIMGTGLLLVALETTATCGLVALLAVPFADLFLGSADWADAVRWMAFSAWTGSIWRMVHQVFRMERRAVTWSVFQWVRPIVVVALTWLALDRGFGISGVLAATAAGTIVSGVVAMCWARRLYVFQPTREDAGVIWFHGKQWIPLNIATAVQGNASVLLLGLIAPAASVGIYQAAARIAALPSYISHGFLMGWAPLERAAIAQAAKQRKGARDFSASVFTLFALLTLGLAFVVALGADALIRVAAPEYASATSLIPVLVAANVSSLVFRGVYRATAFPHRRYWFTALLLIWIAPYGATAALISPIDPSYGVAIAEIVASVFVTVWFVALDRRGGTPTRFEWVRLGKTLAVAIVCLALIQAAPIGVYGHLALALFALTVFPMALLRLGVVNAKQKKIIRAIIWDAFPGRRRRKALKKEIARLPFHEQTLLRDLANHRWNIDAAASATHSDRTLVAARLVRALRRINGTGGATNYDASIGEYVAGAPTTLERDIIGDHLQRLGTDPLELHMLAETANDLRRFTRSRPQRILGPAPLPNPE